MPHPAPAAAAALCRRDLPAAAAQIELRAKDDAPPVIAGYAAVYYVPGDPTTEFELWEDLFERIMPGAAAGVIAAQNEEVHALFNHNPAHLLGRRGAGTLRLFSDSKGFGYEIDPNPDTAVGRDVLAHLQRRDITGSSFAFVTAGPRATRGKVTWTQEQRDGRTVEIREVHEFTAFDVGPVTRPAYNGTTAGLRDEDHARQLLAELAAARGSRGPDEAEVAARARLARARTAGFPRK
jgi:HK97 family phage prohead protease